jgi:ABC-type transport system involved in Fe-S cluster assembly fused permease/ATPase subunit
VENNMVITLFIIGILLSISLCRFCKAVLFQLKVAETIKDNIASTTQTYYILGLMEELEEFQDKLCKLIDNLLDINNTTKIMITHRLDEASLKKFDEIVVMKNGNIVEFGTYNELMNKNGIFKSLVELG